MLDTVIPSIYQLVVPLLEAQYPGIPVVTDNEAFDWNNAPADFFEVEIEFVDAEQVGMSDTPRSRHTGVIHVTHYFRAGAGTIQQMARLAWLVGQIAYTSPGVVQIQSGALGNADAPADWVARVATFTFYTRPV